MDPPGRHRHRGPAAARSNRGDRLVGSVFPLIGKALAIVVAGTLLAVSGWWVGRAIDPRSADADATSARNALIAGRSFLDEYVEIDGRVIRRDQGGDVVSEGQAFAMLIAAAVGDQERFRSVWSWTKANLRRADGLLSWRWVDGSVVDSNTAADADRDAARALLVAGERFGDPGLTADGRALGAAVLTHETMTVGTATASPLDPAARAGARVVGAGRVLTAGNWTTAPPYMVSLGYFSPRAEQELAQDSSDARWTELTHTHRIIAWQLVGSGLLPPDWVRLDAAGTAIASARAGRGRPQFGLEAARFPISMAESCNAADKDLAVAVGSVLQKLVDPPAIMHLDGSAAADWRHPITMVAVAATDYASGDDRRGARSLDAATALQQLHPTYYGAAWVALGRIMLTTDMLGSCEPGMP